MILPKPTIDFKRHSMSACNTCSIYDACGGMYGGEELVGCFLRCSNECLKNGCDYVCPAKPVEYWKKDCEVDGISTPIFIDLTKQRTKPSLPLYLPNILHKYTRYNDINYGFVVLPLYEIFEKKKKGCYKLIGKDTAAIREKFKLGPNTKILLSGVAVDRRLEAFWAEFENSGIAEQLSAIDTEGITSPNFSFFLDAPRTHTLFNRKRMLLLLRDFASVGLPIIPHLQAITQTDWKFWKDFLQDHKALNKVAMEFQTGGRNQKVGERMFDNLLDLRECLGRNIQPIVLGGGRYFDQFLLNYSNPTFIDSTPFGKTMKRQKGNITGNRIKWSSQRTLGEECLSHLLDHNLLEYETWLKQKRELLLYSTKETNKVS